MTSEITAPLIDIIYARMIEITKSKIPMIVLIIAISLNSPRPDKIPVWTDDIVLKIMNREDILIK